MKIVNKVICGAVLSGVFLANLEAKEYLSFDIGKVNKQEVEAQLTSGEAAFETGYGYKGYRDLPMFKVSRYSTFGQYGEVESAWLKFTPDNTLYHLEVSYFDAGKTYTMFRDALGSKYTLIENNSFGFNSSHTYQDGEFVITLQRNEFGFGRDKKTTLIYQYQPALSDVNIMQEIIEQDIRDKNAAKAGDL
ncbi:hypothetical protein OPS25_13905 [Alteromonas ponticola]|uniref:Uncharacterized protein n=1 Tax=Alteromonas aquimaris TaxID=2998417 RepID=A0ABT3P9Z7_9ALTE|nr:hypothetical protein [Alteromonas aquimaris]MCW8109599.1 hypothetical protein [Alteromonas aquimaris]